MNLTIASSESMFLFDSADSADSAISSEVNNSKVNLSPIFSSVTASTINAEYDSSVSNSCSPLLSKIKDTLQELYIQIKKLFDKLFSGAQSDKAREIINSDKMATNIAEMKRKASGLTSSATLRNAWGQIGGSLGGLSSKGVGLCIPKARTFTDMFSDASTSIIPASVAMDANSLTREANSIEISAGYASSSKDSYMKNSNATENMAKYRQLSVELDRMLTDLHGALANAMVMK